MGRRQVNSTDHQIEILNTLAKEKLAQRQELESWHQAELKKILGQQEEKLQMLHTLQTEMNDLKILGGLVHVIRNVGW